MNLLHYEPVAIGGAVRAVIYMSSVLWWKLNDTEMIAVIGVVEAVVGVFTRQSVTSTNTIHQAGLTVNKIEAAAAANVATGKAE